MGLLRFCALLVLFAQDRVALPRFEAFPGELRLGTPSLTNAIADYDGDGDLDIYVGMNGSPNRLYRNDGGSFTEVAGDAGIADGRATRSAAWSDFDADGDPDLLVGFAGPAGILKLYRNDAGRFIDITRESGLQRDSAAVRQLSWIDLDADGDLDLFVAFRDKPNALYRNEGGDSPMWPRRSVSPIPERASGRSGSTMTRTAISTSTWQTRTATGTASGGMTAEDSATWPIPPARPGAAGNPMIPATARSVPAPRMWTAMAGSTSSPPTTAAMASCSIGPGGSRTSPPRGASIWTPGTTPAPLRTSITTGGSISM